MILHTEKSFFITLSSKPVTCNLKHVNHLTPRNSSCPLNNCPRNTPLSPNKPSRRNPPADSTGSNRNGIYSMKTCVRFSQRIIEYTDSYTSWASEARFSRWQCLVLETLTVHFWSVLDAAKRASCCVTLFSLPWGIDRRGALSPEL